jgi:two-component system, NtrC family, sensor kinase
MQPISPPSINRRILVVDDNRSIHEDYRKVLERSASPMHELMQAEAVLFNKAIAHEHRVRFELTSAYQGNEALDLVQQAVSTKQSFAVAFVDIRMPPGWDGLETAARLSEADPELQIVICTAFSDYTWSQIHHRLGQSDRLLILKKPFDNMELIQLASTLTEKWNLNRLARSRLEDLQEMVAERTRELQQAYEELKRSQERSVLQERLAAVGQLAAGVAQEFNNIMTVIRGYSSLLLAEAALPLDAVECLQEIHNGAERAANLTYQLLAFSRRQAMHLRPHDLNEVLRKFQGALPRLTDDKIRIELDTTPEPLPFRADLGMIEQLLSHLIKNARDAMPKGGGITIKTRLVASEAISPSSHPEAYPGTFVCLEVVDGGCGMDTLIRSRLFTPFFTTKEIGKGLGMGLAAVYGIVKQHHGWIEVESEPGHGSLFRVLLPASVHKIEEGMLATSQRQSGLSALNILVVDESPAVLTMMQKVLEQQGHLVLPARSLVDALQVWDQHNASIQIALIDLDLPTTTTTPRQLAARLKSSQSKLRVLFTGHLASENPDAPSPGASENGFLRKPFDSARLITAVNQLNNL